MTKKKDTTSGWLPCGCHINDGQIQFCEFHGKLQQMANVLNLVRGYFLKTTGEESPFVKKVDELLPRA